MAHFKVWLGVTLTLGLAALVWLIPPKLNQQLQETQPRLAPIAQNNLVQKQLASFFEKHIKDLRRLTTHKGLRAALTELAAKKPDRRNKRHRKAHQALNVGFPFFRGAQQAKRVYVFSYAGKLVFRTDAPTKFEEDETMYSRSPFVRAVRNNKGKPSYGFWRLGGQPYFLSAVPIGAGASSLGILMMSMKVDRELFVEMGIHPDTRKTHPLLLIDREKPLAKAIPKGIRGATRQWIEQQFHKLSKQLQQGLYISPKTVKLGGHEYSYLIARMPVPITDSSIGYVLLTQMPKATPPTNDLYRGPLSGWIAMGAGGLGLLLALWFSLGLMGTRRKLKQAVQQAAASPGQPQAIDQIPGAFKALKAPLKLLMDKAQALPSGPAPSTPQPRPAPTPVPAPTPAPATKPQAAPAAKIATPAPSSQPASAEPPFPSPIPSPIPTPPPASAPRELAQQEVSYKPQEPPVTAPQEATSAAPPQEQLPDFSDELEDAFAGIQEEDMPGHMGPAHTDDGAKKSGQTLMYQQFGDEELSAAAAKIQEEKLRGIYQDYIDMRQQCGESIQNIEFEQFTERLAKQREAIIQQFSCDDVQFHIYEKGGRAAIKATPVK